MQRLVLAATAALVSATAVRADAPPPLVVVDPAGAAHSLDSAALASLPARQVEVSFATGHGPYHATLAGPLLWDALVEAGAVPPGGPRAQARLAVVVTGADGYAAVLALGEVSPDLAGKPALLAEQANGKPLGAGHLRLALPGDAHGARNVRDVVRIAVEAVGSR